ncbi:MAG TPA: methyltransferase domain-containing protein [Longimicrobiaceae bacterium]|nr:methyltransferase domain-containing protein [Longimicrobiaceae bacterium]
MLDLVRLSPEPVFPPGGEALYRQIARIIELREGQEVLDAACGRGVSLSFLASAYGIEGSGVDPDPNLVREAEQRARAARLDHRLQFQSASLDDLPYKDAIFDVAIGEIGLAASADAACAVRELVRVTKPMGSVVLVQLVWTGHVDEERKEILVQHLGARPMMLVEWKQFLRDAGVVDLVVEDWSDQPSRPLGRAPFPDFAHMFTLREKMKIMQRAMQRWGWRGVRGAILREQQVHLLLTRERVLGLSLIKGVRWHIEEAHAGAQEMGEST